MNDINKLFFELIRVSIDTQECLSRIPSAKEWKKLYDMAMKQSLIGICFAGVQKLGGNSDDGFIKLGMPEMLYLMWMGTAAQIQQRNEFMNRRCVELQERLHRDGFRSCILKGQGVASLYKIKDDKGGVRDLSALRQSGDIDVWIDASDYEVIDYVMSSSPTKEFDQKHIHFRCFDDTEVEAHWFPVKWENPWHNKILLAFIDKERESQFNNHIDGVCVPTVSFQLAHQLLHVFRHYVYEGVGLRQMMDLYFAQSASYESEVWKVLDLFKKLGLMRFVAAAQWVLGEVFRMPHEQMICEPDEKEGQRLLDEIITGGNFGHFNDQNQVIGETFMQRFLRRWGRKFRMFRFDPMGTLLLPFTRIALEIWMRRVRRKYNV